MFFCSSLERGLRSILDKREGVMHTDLNDSQSSRTEVDDSQTEKSRFSAAGEQADHPRSKPLSENTCLVDTTNARLGASATFDRTEAHDCHFECPSKKMDVVGTANVSVAGSAPPEGMEASRSKFAFKKKDAKRKDPVETTNASVAGRTDKGVSACGQVVSWCESCVRKRWTPIPLTAPVSKPPFCCFRLDLPNSQRAFLLH
jgi:hypothetical protein